MAKKKTKKPRRRRRVLGAFRAEQYVNTAAELAIEAHDHLVQGTSAGERIAAAKPLIEGAIRALNWAEFVDRVERSGASGWVEFVERTKSRP